MLDRIGEGVEEEDLGFTREALVDLGLPEPSFEFFQGLREDRNLKASLYGVLVDEVPLQEVIIPTEINNLDLVPSHIYLADVDLQLAAVHDNRSARLKRGHRQD